MNDLLIELKRVKDVVRDYQIKGYPKEVEVGDYTYGVANVEGVNEGDAKCVIGKYCSISHDVTIMLGGNHRPDWNSTYPFNILMPSFAYIKGNPTSKGDVIIGNDVWIGAGAKIMSGVTVADGTVIGANALVTKSTEPYSIVGGVPAKLIKKRFSDDIIERFLEMKWWDWPEEQVLETIPLLQSNDVDGLYNYYLNNVANRKGQAIYNTAIIIVSYNACYMIQENIWSIRNTLEHGTYHIYVVDNASTDGVEKWLKEQAETFDDISVQFNEENVGFPKACNQGVQFAESLGDIESDIYLLNNDTRLCKNSLKNLKDALYSSEDIGAAGSISNYAGNNQQIDITFSLPSGYLEWGNKNNVLADDLIQCELWEERIRLSGFSMLIKREVWNNAGGMDEQFSPGYFEDDDLSMKILSQGRRLLLCHNSFIYHAGSQSFSKIDGVNDLLKSHYKKFINKYGFPIIEYAYPDKAELDKIPYTSDKEFAALIIGSGIGANIKYVRSKYKNAAVYGVEADEKMSVISCKTDKVYVSIDKLLSDIGDTLFDVIYADENELNKLSDEDFARLNARCSDDCIILPNNSVDLSKVKLVIWDLDNTFWDGILSEGNIIPVETNIELVKNLTDCGIINSISSKNNRDEVMEKLNELGVSDYFVFNNINWDNKGEQIKQKLEQMGLRAENVLFIDDDIRNLEEADYCNEGIIASDPMIISELITYISGKDKTDTAHKRLAHYKLLETKRNEEKKYSSKEKFLYDSEIYIEIDSNCLNDIDRIADLVARSNQLNFTKVRDNKKQLTELVNDKYIEKGLIRAKDKFGDYGLIGFYCFDKNGNLRHFLFSCRVIGMGIEQKIYKMLGCPNINISTPVAVTLNSIDSCDWIKTNVDELMNEEYKSKNTDKANTIRILLKGPCDLAAIESYFSGGNITTEFNYVNDDGFVTTGQNHSMHICESVKFTKEDIDNISKTAPFITYGDFETSVFDKEYDVICYSMLPDCQAGYYTNKENGYCIAFSSLNFDLTNADNINKFIDGSMQNHGYHFTKEIIDKFRENWTFKGGIPVEQTINNLEYIYDNAKGNPTFVLLLGSETEYDGDNAEFANLVQRHKQFNAAIREFAKDRNRVRLINTTGYIKSQDDYIDCINHYARNVYYDMATDIVTCINDKVSEIQKTRSVKVISEPKPYDALIMATPSDYSRLERLYPRMLATIPAKKICFVGNEEVGELVKKSGLDGRIGYINENDILTFDEVHAVMTDALKDILLGRELPRGVTGWYYQQFLKMGYSKICTDEYYLVWDGDTVPCAGFSMFKTGTDKPYFDLKTEYHEEYFTTLSKLIPGLRKVIKKSFVSEHMLMKADFMAELISVIESNTALKGTKFYEKIIYAIEPEKLLSNSFSEFETYGSYIAVRHMDAYMLRDWHSFRYGGDFFDMNTISDSDFEWLSHDFNAISFEKGHEVREDHKNLFDNKEYQSKLSARQMLEIAQEEFKGDSFIESWD